MTKFENVSPPDQLRDSLIALFPDVRSDLMSTFRPDGSLSKLTLTDQHQEIAQYEFIDSVPLDIRVHFETAKNLYLYAWFVYRFYPVAEKHVLATLEFALRERLTAWLQHKYGLGAKIPRGLSKLFSKAVSENLITNSGLRRTERHARVRARERFSMEICQRMIAEGLNEIEYDDSDIQILPEDYVHDSLKIFGETLPYIRNTYAHGSSMLHATVLGTFEIVTDLVNELYASK